MSSNVKTRKVDLTDPDFEPTLEDFKRLTQSAGDKVRAESAMLAARKKDGQSAKPAPAN